MQPGFAYLAQQAHHQLHISRSSESQSQVSGSSRTGCMSLSLTFRGAVFRPDISATYENYLVVSLCSMRSTNKSLHMRPLSSAVEMAAVFRDFSGYLSKHLAEKRQIWPRTGSVRRSVSQDCLPQPSVCRLDRSDASLSVELGRSPRRKQILVWAPLGSLPLRPEFLLAKQLLRRRSLSQRDRETGISHVIFNPACR